MNGFPGLPGAAAFLGFPALRWFKRAAWHAGRRGAEIRARTWLTTSLAGLLALERACASRKETRDKRREEKRRGEQRRDAKGWEGKGREGLLVVKVWLLLFRRASVGVLVHGVAYKGRGRRGGGPGASVVAAAASVSSAVAAASVGAEFKW